ncbi:uncharacterized protein LOC117070369 isoform X3 [Trachypithecus francoisi]|uniref:uncharacterized protein LOC117070369 isoform X3 n=1 Tax=Trachypithecus francoisi TaxID=54180 RepID=UPI00141A82E2|nr:uncharacterized protein LOC117070369 isoform X3 [Trachypithecus francoisi]
MQALERENDQMAAGIQRRKGRPQQRPQASLQILQREGAVGPRSAKELESAVWTPPEASGLSLWIQSWVLSCTGPADPLLGSVVLEQKSPSRTEDWTHKTSELSTALLFTS